MTMVLTTHKHWDHAGGNTAMHKALPDVPILGGAVDQVHVGIRKRGLVLVLHERVELACPMCVVAFHPVLDH